MNNLAPIPEPLPKRSQKKKKIERKRTFCKSLCTGDLPIALIPAAPEGAKGRRGRRGAGMIRGYVNDAEQTMMIRIGEVFLRNRLDPLEVG
ncbi:hypothetical protein CEXT_651941 [Caerostris extrusa]|uniref:Uncharacterized protein n=1 Tax=Caerostris extrusa TaxID=172846 RepID=A0AAV4WUT3_CAEEX|nr:hypothetical protein CEXT_651941 [Caerostris extrusa]